MLDVYENLENYDDINSFEQLKSENKDLKLKLEEYKAALSKLQKDFDNLTCQHQQLLANYSSLLKTARAEVERKTEAITNINKEKDKIFLRFLSEKTNKNLSKGGKVFQDKGPEKKSDTRRPKIRKKDGPIHEATDSKCDLRKTSLKCVDSHSERKDNAPASQDNSTSAVNDHSTIKKDAPNSRMVLEEKVRNKDNQKSNEESHPSNIANQRISQQHPRHEYPKFSSEEDDNRSSTTSRSIPSRDEINAAPIRFSEQLKPKPDDFYQDDKYFDHKDLRDRPRNSRDEMYSSDKYRQSRYEESYRYRDSRSRGRSYGGRDRGRNDNIRYRNRSRHRERESPPLDRYQRNKSRDRRFYDRERPNYEIDRQPSCHDKQAVKHKIRQDVEETGNKRRKIESNRNEDERYRHENVLVQQKVPEPIFHSEFTSCQSPDEIHVEKAAMSQPIKEIMYTAETPQEDPRKNSTRYIPIGEGKNKVWLSESATQLQLIKVGPWSPNNKELQKQKCKEDLVSQIYMDIDNECIELEPGEINDLDIYSDILPSSDVCVDTKLINEAKLTHDPLALMQPNIEVSTSTQLGPDNQFTEMQQKFKISKKTETCSIPQTSKAGIFKEFQEIPSSFIPVKLLDSLKQINFQDIDKASTSYEHCDTILSQKLWTKDKIAKNIHIDNNKPLKVSRLNTPAKRTIVAGDLELSEESSDSNEERNRNVKQIKEHSLQTDNVSNASKNKDEEEKVQVETKKDELKKKEINDKLSDLFGDSSLLMPEDLHLPSTQVNDDCSDYPPSPPPELSPDEPANDVWDHTIKKFVEVRKNEKMPVLLFEKKEDDSKKHDNKDIKHNKKPNDKKAEKRSTKKKHGRDDENLLESTKKTKDKIMDDIETENKKIIVEQHRVSPSDDIETEQCIRIFPTANTIEQDVYKTVIISTGQQPENISTSDTTGTSNLSDDKSKSEVENQSKETLNTNTNITKTSNETLSSFATSTPERSLRNVSLESRSNMTENFTSNSAQENDTASNQSVQNNPSDAPDVRVMLKRRKKRIVK